MALTHISILGCGYLGFPLAERLAEKGRSVRGSTTTEEKLSQLHHAGIHPFLMDIHPSQDFSLPEEFFHSDVLFLNIPFRRHFKDPWDYQKQIQKIIPSIRRSSLQKIIFASSTSVYPSTLQKADEEAVFEPENERAKVLLALEEELLEMKAVVLRFAGLYGYERRIGRFLSGKKNLGHGAAPVNLVHRDDCVAIVEQIMEGDFQKEIFNVCSDAHPTREALYRQKAEVLGIALPVFDNQGVPAVKCVVNQKLKQTLGYNFLHPTPLTDE